jgi:hypothetical protein
MSATQISLDRKKQKRYKIITGVCVRCVHACVIPVIEKTQRATENGLHPPVPRALHKPPPSLVPPRSTLYMANRVARHDTTRTRLNTTRFDTNTVGHDYLSCRVVFARVQKPRHEHDTKGIVSCRAGTTTRPAHRAVSTRTRFTEKSFIRDNLHFFVLVVVDDRRQPLVPRRTSHHLRKDQRAKEEVH